MRKGQSEKPAKGRRSRRNLWIAIIFGLLTGLAGLAEPLEDGLRDVRDHVERRTPSGNIVVVGIDDKSMAKLQRWPWPRQHHARLIEELNRRGAKEIYFDIDFSPRSDNVNDAALRDAIAHSRAKVTLPVQFVRNPLNDVRTDLLPLPMFRENAELATINVRHSFLGRIRTLPYNVQVAGKDYPSFAAKMSGVQIADREEPFPIDFSIDPGRLQVVSASDLILKQGQVPDLTDKIVLIGLTAPQLRDLYVAPSHGLISGVFFHALGAETLSRGKPLVIGWWPAYILGLLALLATRRLKKRALTCAILGGAIVATGAVQWLLEARNIFFEIMPMVAMLGIVLSFRGSAYIRELYTRRGRTNIASGLPNLQALLEEVEMEPRALIVAKVHNFSEIASAFRVEGEEGLVDKLADRLALVTPADSIHQGDEGVFAWVCDEEIETVEGQLSSLYEIFRMPLNVDGCPVDVRLTFGIDNQAHAASSVRLGGALVAADDALKVGDKWKRFDPAQVSETAWKLSLMGQLGRAVADEDIWVAFQPKLQLSNNRIVGAEALVRWNHPERGEIAPADFILAAEQNGRIDELTYYVLRRSVAAISKLSAGGVEFGVAVNISATLIGSVELSTAIEDLLNEFGVSPHLLTLEITETAALTTMDQQRSATLKRLQQMGVRLSIDDYGTGLSTMDYLKRIPASELKIDRSFVNAIDTSRTDRLMVQSTIELAHSLGQQVVAEGVERQKTLHLLKEMGCDFAQGYLISRPGPYEDLEKLLKERSRAA